MIARLFAFESFVWILFKAVSKNKVNVCVCGHACVCVCMHVCVCVCLNVGQDSWNA